MVLTGYEPRQYGEKEVHDDIVDWKSVPDDIGT